MIALPQSLFAGGANCFVANVVWPSLLARFAATHGVADAGHRVLVIDQPLVVDQNHFQGLLRHIAELF